MLSVTFELLVDTDPNYQLQLRLLPDIQLVAVAVFWGPSGGSYNWSLGGYTYHVHSSSYQFHWIHGLHEFLASFINVSNNFIHCLYNHFRLCSARTLHNIDRMVGVLHTEVARIESWPEYDGYGWQFSVGYLELNFLHGSLTVILLI